MDWFPENQHVILDHNQRLAEGGPIVVIHHIQCRVIDFGWVGYEVTDGAHFFIIGICFDPLIPRRETNSNCAVDKCLNPGGGHDELVWKKQFTVGISKVKQMCMDLLGQPLGCAGRHGSVNTEYAWWLSVSVSELVDEVEATDELIGQNSSDV